MEEERKESMAEQNYDAEEKADFDYMNDLLKAYNETLAAKRANMGLPDEKKAYVASAERMVKEMCSVIAAGSSTAEVKELALMAKESAEQCLSAIGAEEQKEDAPYDHSRFPISALLTRCVLLSNRALNALVRSGTGNERAVMPVLSALSALYAIAAIR